MLVGVSNRDEGILIMDGKDFADVKLCPHCGLPFVYIKGSGKVRGRCSQCPGRMTCGSIPCLTHSDIRQRLDWVEEGRIPLSAL